MPDTDRRTWLVDLDASDRSAADRACRALLELVRPLAETAFVDAWSDYRDELPAPVAAAETALRDAGRAQGRRAEGMGIAVDVADDGEWHRLLTYAAWSIHVEVSSREVVDLATLHDCAWSVTADLLPGEVDRLRAELAGTATLELLDDVHARAREQRRRQRRDRWARRRDAVARRFRGR